MADRNLIKATEVATKLSRPVSWFYRNRKKLEAKNGFPSRVSGCGNRWDPLAIDLWLSNQMPEYLKNAEEDPDNEDWAEKLDAAAEAIGKGLGKET